MKSKLIKVVAVVPTFQSYVTLIACVNSLLEQNFKLSEIVIVDNNTKSKKLKFKSNIVKVVTPGKNLGVSGGRNKGLDSISGKYEYVLFFDHDMVADVNMVKCLLETAKRITKAGIITPKIYYWEQKKIIWAAGTEIDTLSGQVLFRGGNDTGQYDEEQEVQVAPAAIFVKKIVINKIKCFDERYFATYEDTDFCFRAKSVGYSTMYAPDAIAYHKIPYDEKKSNLKLLSRSYYVAKNRIIFMKKYGQNFLLFCLFFIPVYACYYLILSLKYNRLSEYKNYLKGTIAGLTN